MIVAADLHLTEESEGIVFDKVLPGLVEAARSPRRAIAILGDIYHVRYRVSVRLQNRLYNFLAGDDQIDWILLPGNHDQVNAQGEHALEVFRDLDNVEVKTEPAWDRWGLWIPYRKHTGDIQRALDHDQAQGSPPVAWMHHGIQGFFMNNTLRDLHGVPMSSLAGFKQVFLGHYHKPQENGNIAYIGSPYQTRADEAGQQKRYGVWDPETLTMSYVPVRWGRQFVHLEVTVDSPMVLTSDVCPQDEIRIQAGPGVSPEELGKALAMQGFTNVVVTPAQEARQTRLQVAPGKGLTAYAEEYAKQFAGDLDPEKLLDLWREVTA